MNVLFATQSESLRMFDALRGALQARRKLSRAGFTLADSAFYRRWLADEPDFESRGHALLKEWHVTGKRNGTPDRAKLATYERELGCDAGLFGAIVADRRLFMGPDCTFTQDYRRRFTDDELLCILQEGLEATERLFDELKPDVLVGFICVTMLEYLAYLFARARGVRVLNLRPTRLGDRVVFSSILNDPAPEFVAAYEHARAAGSPHLDEARAYITRVREQHGRYEGVVAPSAGTALKVNPAREPVAKAALRVVTNYLQYRRSEASRDNHVADPLRALWFAAAVNPWRARRAASWLAAHYVPREQLTGQRYVFYPLHTEPEVSLLVYGRPFVNQIEIIRQLAMSLPVDMLLVVKEHPWMVGKRTRAAYSKMLNIPRVRIVSPALEARSLITGASLVAVVTGSVALEAAMLGKPVITFGDCPYNTLPPSMVRRAADLRALPALVRDAIDGYRNDEQALESYVAGTFDISQSVHLYSVLLRKRGVHVERETGYAEEIEMLASYAIDCLARPVAGTHAAAARW